MDLVSLQLRDHTAQAMFAEGLILPHILQK